MMNIVGSFLRSKREAVGLSQRALGQLFAPPVTTQFISNIERGVTPLPPVHIPTLVRALQLTESELISVLEREYATKINHKFNRSSNGENDSSFHPLVHTAEEDRSYFQAIYDSYSRLDSQQRETFQSVCETLLGVPKK
jgi:transcriptional regulator with XRE-family HTH domain